jgi:hypothetical protein
MRLSFFKRNLVPRTNFHALRARTNFLSASYYQTKQYAYVDLSEHDWAAALKVSV